MKKEPKTVAQNRSEDENSGNIRSEGEHSDRGRRRWRVSWLSVVITAMGLIGVLLILYPTAAAWVSQYNQSQIISSYDDEVASAQPTAAVQWEQAQLYNRELQSGAFLESNANKPTAGAAGTNGTGEDGASTEASAGASAAGLVYSELLKVDDEGLMGHLKIPAISADLPIYHGTDDSTLERGIGHLEGTSLPVGGRGTRSVLTGHRGLSTARLFTDLDNVGEGDTFTLEILDQVLTYEVVEVKVVDPDQTQELLTDSERDLVTLVTCTPLGINSQRILVTGQRVTPTPLGEIEAAGADPEVPGFPWWAVAVLGAFALAGIYLWRAGYRNVSAQKVTVHSLHEGR